MFDRGGSIIKLYRVLALSLGAVVLTAPVAQAKMTKQQAIEACRAEAKQSRIGHSGSTDPHTWVSNCVKQKLRKR
jgi:hypothetical protein